MAHPRCMWYNGTQSRFAESFQSRQDGRSFLPPMAPRVWRRGARRRSPSSARRCAGGRPSLRLGPAARRLTMGGNRRWPVVLSRRRLGARRARTDAIFHSSRCDTGAYPRPRAGRRTGRTRYRRPAPAGRGDGACLYAAARRRARRRRRRGGRAVGSHGRGAGRWGRAGHVVHPGRDGWLALRRRARRHRRPGRQRVGLVRARRGTAPRGTLDPLFRSPLVALGRGACGGRRRGRHGVGGNRRGHGALVR